jgi:hypothetical protein
MGGLWAVAVGGGAVTFSLLVIDTWPRSVTVGWIVSLAALIAIAVVVIRAGLRLPRDDRAMKPGGNQLRKRFLLVFGVELLAFAIVNPVLAIHRQFELMPAANLVIIGLHFLPLARVFVVPRYYLMGALFCLIPMATIFATSKDFLVGHALAWYVVPTIGCGVVATLTGIAGLRESWQLASRSAGMES